MKKKIQTKEVIIAILCATIFPLIYFIGRFIVYLFTI